MPHAAERAPNALITINPQRRRLRRFRRLLLLVAISLAVIVAFERLWPQLWLTHSRPASLAHFAAFLLRTFEFHLGLAAAALAGLALLARARRASLFAAAITAFCLAPVVWSYLPARQSPTVVRAAHATDIASAAFTDGASEPRPLRVLAMNLLIGLENLDAALIEIRRIDPDVIGFIEYNPAAHRVLHPALRDAYPHIIDAGSTGTFGQAVYSRLPLVDQLGRTREEGNGLWRPEIDMADAPGLFLGPQIRTVVRAHDGSTVAVRFVHLTSPSLPSRLANQRREFPFLLERLADDRARWPNFVVAGDFNAPTNSDLIAAIRNAGFKESSIELGLGRAATWPRRTFLKHFPNVRIDHVFIADLRNGHGLRFAAAGQSGDFGSDHRAVWADLLPEPTPPAIAPPRANSGR